MVTAPMAVPVAADRGAGGGSSSAVTWSAIIAGGVTAAAVSFILFVLGAGLGLTAVSPWSSDMGTVTALGVGTLVWLVVTQWVASGLGGYLTGRLRTRWVNLHTDEVFFRDTAHGFLAWAVATLLTAALFASAMTAVVAGTASSATTVLGGAAEGAAQSADEASPGTAYFVDTLFRSDRPAAGDAGRDAARGEGERILLRSLADGSISPEDKTHLARVVAAQTGLSQPEAEQRVDQVMGQVTAAVEQAKQIADDARQAAATLAIVAFLSLLIGAFIAAVAAALGGRERDDIENRYAQR
jgi:hypothetical protein